MKVRIPFVAVALLLLLPHVKAQISIERVSVSSGGQQSEWPARPASFALGGRVAVFTSADFTLAPGYSTPFEFSFPFTRDLWAGVTDWVSLPISTNYAWNAAGASEADIVYFLSLETHLPGGEPGTAVGKLYRRPATGGEVSLVKNALTLPCAGVRDYDPAPSADGRFIVLAGPVCFFRQGTTESQKNTWLLDVETNSTTLLSRSLSGQPLGSAGGYAISSDGRWTAFWSWTQVEGLGHPGNNPKLYVYDRLNDTIAWINIADDARHFGQAATGEPRTSISDDGRFISFVSRSDLIVPGDSNSLTDAFLHDRETGANTLISLTLDGQQVRSGPTYSVAMSGDARLFVYILNQQLLLWDRVNGTRQLVVPRPRFAAHLSQDGRYVLTSLEDVDIDGSGNGVTDVVRIHIENLWRRVFADSFEEQIAP